MNSAPRTDSRTGARRRAEVPAEVLDALAEGRSETVNLMEWLAADMSRLGRSVARELGGGPLAEAIAAAAEGSQGLGITRRLIAMGDAIAAHGGADPDGAARLSAHRSDLVRQWACYAANAGEPGSEFRDRLAATLPFADDPNMSVREAAWMAFRPHLAARLDWGLAALTILARDERANVRRFAVEVSRPRSVWGAHIAELKAHPEQARGLLENVRRDPSRYVQLAAGNWLNDASKSRPDWVTALCADWIATPHRATDHIVRRGLRTVIRGGVNKKSRAAVVGAEPHD